MPTKKSHTKKSKRVTKTKRVSKSASIKVVTSKKDHKLIWFVILFCCLQSIAGFLWYQLYAHTVLSFAISPVVTATHTVTGSPTHITIPDAEIDLSVIPANIEKGIWQIPNEAAAHLASSAQPGQGGNVVVYAHNKQNLFGPLKQVTDGDIITVKTTSNTTHKYEVREIVTVSPDEISVAMPTDYEVLTVYTCTGFLDSQRLVVKAYPISVSSL